MPIIPRKYTTISLGRCTLHFGDCLDVMQNITDGSIDMILADLPYGTTACKWDTIIPFEPLWAQYKRIIRSNGAIVLTATQPFASALVMSNPKWFRYEWIWRKTKPVGHLRANNMPMKSHENICVFSASPPTYHPQGLRPVDRLIQRTNPGGVYGGYSAGLASRQKFEGYPRTVLDFCNASEKRYHGTQKPVVLMEYLIRTYTDEGETVLDNTMGSGTTGVACFNTERQFIGIEKDADIYAIAKRRIREAKEAKAAE